jgi:hypothetical protein
MYDAEPDSTIDPDWFNCIFEGINLPLTVKLLRVDKENREEESVVRLSETDVTEDDKEVTLELSDDKVDDREIMLLLIVDTEDDNDETLPDNVIIFGEVMLPEHVIAE